LSRPQSADAKICAGHNLRRRIKTDLPDALIAGVSHKNRTGGNANAVRAIEPRKIARAIGVAGEAASIVTTFDDALIFLIELPNETAE